MIQPALEMDRMRHFLSWISGSGVLIEGLVYWQALLRC